MADRAAAKSKAKSYTKSKKKGAMDGMTVKGGHKQSVKEGAGLTEGFDDCCYCINGGWNGYEDRAAKYKICLDVFNVE